VPSASVLDHWKDVAYVITESRVVRVTVTENEPIYASDDTAMLDCGA